MGDKFLEALRLDKSGACYLIFPDCPLIDFPEVNFVWAFSMIAFGRFIARPLRLRSFDVSDFIIFCLVICILTIVFVSVLF